MNLSSVLTWKLYAWANVPVYAFQKPINATLPCLVHQIVSDPIQDHNHSGGGRTHLTRVQITHIGSTDVEAKNLADTVYQNLEGNKTDFSAAISTGMYFERQEADGVYVVVKDYFIQYQS